MPTGQAFKPFKKMEVERFRVYKTKKLPCIITSKGIWTILNVVRAEKQVQGAKEMPEGVFSRPQQAQVG